MANPLFDALFGRHAGNLAPFLHLEGGRVISYDAFVKLAARFANAITDMGVARGDRVAAQTAQSTCQAKSLGARRHHLCA